MIDSLIQYLLEEIAMDGDEGTSINDLATLISDFYSSRSTSSSSSTPTPAQHQLIDDPFLTFIWNTLVEQPDVRVGVLKLLELPPKHGNNDEEIVNPEPSSSSFGPSQPSTVVVEKDGSDSDLKPIKRPARKKPTSAPSTTPTHELTLLSPSTSSLGYSHLSSLYSSSGGGGGGGQLRVLASPETAWKAITGSHSKPNSITPMVYQVLQMVSRGRREGVTTVRLSRELGVDPKSMFHYVKITQKLDIAKKITAVDEGARTNRIIHNRYLSTSPYWASHIASEPSAANPSNNENEEEDAEEGGASGSGNLVREEGQMSTLSVMYLETNPKLIKNRIVRALKSRGLGRGGREAGREEDCWMPHGEIASSIGLHAMSSILLRRLNAIVNSLVAQGVCEKIAVTKKHRRLAGKSKGQVESVTTIQALRLISSEQKQRKVEEGNDLDSEQQGTNEEEEEEEEEDDQSYPIASTSIERQILDMLMEADTRGLISHEIHEALGRITLRGVDAILQRLGRQFIPPEYFDTTITAFTETIGRIKQTRWFSLGGYIAMRREKGIPDSQAEEKWEQGFKAYEEEVGKSREGGEDHAQYVGVEERRKWLSRYRTMDHTGNGLAEAGVSVAKKPRGRPRKTPKDEDEGKAKKGGKKVAAKGKGKEKADDTDDPEREEVLPKVEGDDDDEDQDSVIAKPKPPPRPRGRPRKPGSKPSWYHREQQINAERVAQGLEPLESYYQRKKREAEEDREREEEGLPPLVRRKDTTKRKRQSIEPQEQDGDGSQVDELDEDETLHEPPPPPPRKRGRPSALDELAAAALEVERSERDGDSPVPPVEAEIIEEESTPARRPTKRARFSLPAVDDGDGGAVTQPAPAPAGRRRGRSSGAPLVPGPELDGAPVRPSPPSRAAAGSTPTKDAPSSATPQSASRTRRPSGLRAVVEIEVPSRSRNKTNDSSPVSAAKASSPAPTQRSIASTSPAPVPASSANQESAPASQGDPGPVVSAAQSSPGPASTPAPPISTPAASSQTASASQPRAKRQYRKSVASADNITALNRQKEILDYMTAQGGVIDAVPRLGRFVRDHARESNPSGQAFEMDRHVILSTLATLVKREQLRKTSVVGAKGARHDIYYFPSVALDSPEMTSFLAETVHGEKGKSSTVRAADNIVLDAVLGDVDAEEPRGDGQDRGEGGADATTSEFPKPADSPADVKDYFRVQPLVVGASYGARHGVFSRARQLHKWLASLIVSGRAGELLADSDDQGYVLAHETFVSAMPLIIFTSLVPLPVDSTELRQFLADPNNLFLPLGAVPSSIISILRPNFSKRKIAIWKSIETLMMFNLLSPLSEVRGERGGKSTFVAPARPTWATHWRFNTTVPVYAFARTDVPLVAVSELKTLEAVSEYWTSLQGLAVFRVKSPPAIDPTLATESGFPPRCEVSQGMLTKLRLSSKWKDSYHLLPDQRRFLTELAKADPDLVGDSVDRSQDLEQWADALYAPVDVVAIFLRSAVVKAWKAIEIEIEGERRKKRRIRKTEEGQAVEGEEEWEDVEDDRPSMDAAATLLHRKVQELASQRQRDWKTIVDKFRADHAQPSLDPDIISYLERRFIDPRRQIDAVQLLFELRQLLPDPVVAPGDELLRTVVPHALLVRARQAKDPYAIARKPNIRKRVRALPSKAPPPVQASTVSATEEAPSQPAEVADQTELLTQRVAPGDAVRVKRARNMFSSEQDELLLDGVAVLKARWKTLNVRPSFGALERLFEGHKTSVLRNRQLVLLKKPEDLAFHDRLVDAWLEVYAERKDSDENLKDPHPESMTNFDIASFVRCLREHVDKRALRLTRTVPRPTPPSMFLPASLVALHTGYTLKPTGSLNAVTTVARWEKYWVGMGYASTDREESIARAVLGTNWLETEVAARQATEDEALERDRALTAAAIKMVISSSDETYTPEQGVNILRNYAGYVDQVVQQLKSQHVIISVSSEPGRRIPGRNFSFDDKFYDRLDSSRIKMERLSDAIRFEQKLLEAKERPEQEDVVIDDPEDEEGSGDIFPIIPTEGEIMALVDLVSEGKVDLSIDTITCGEKTMRFDDFGTRQMNDDDIECTVRIEPLTTSPSNRDPAILPRPETLMPKSTTDDASQLEVAATELLARLDGGEEARLVRKILELIEAIGVSGLTHSELCLLLPMSSRFSILATLSRLLESTSPDLSPLIFLTGFSHRPVYVSTVHLPSYAILLPSSSPTTKKRWLIPCIWTGIDGEINKEVWIRCLNFVKGILFKRSGLDFKQIEEISCTTVNGYHTPVLSSLELRIILETLDKNGILTRQSSTFESAVRNGEGAKEPGAKVPVDWETDRWSLKGVFWNA